MSKIAVFYGSSTGNTEKIAKKIAGLLEADVFDIGYSTMERIHAYNNLILGTSTWGFGDLQDDWDAFVALLSSAKLDGKVIALFGLGDSDLYPDTFVNGLGHLYDLLKNKGGKIVGFTDTDGYHSENTDILVDGRFPGLALDEDNEANRSDQRIEKWLQTIRPEFV
ncbi:MAG: flavodoxin [Bacteroidales bacterium]|jgi:flavodoxin I|nr:flavodoxin [Bacteroidales bacterium]MDD3702412.1 flavodoxin [Bacteroidales bacterium]MDY0369201.1 flavodoxin [Bacteroidales bacterium]